MIDHHILQMLGFDTEPRYDQRLLYSYYNEGMGLGIFVEFENEKVLCFRVSYSVSETLECALPMDKDDYEGLLYVLEGYGHKKAATLLRGFKIDGLLAD